MPEGDTIFRAARTLNRALAGQVVTYFETAYAHLARVDDDGPLAGRTIESVVSRGKHLLMIFSGNLVLRTHMRMSGSWHIYRPGERWRLGREAMRVRVDTATWVAVAFNVMDAELVASTDLPRHRAVASLGPDLLSDRYDEDQVLRLMQGHAQAPVADVLLNQRVVSGIGNVYKSESLFLAGIHPEPAVGALDEAERRRVLQVARRLMRANIAASAGTGIVTYGGLRRTAGGTNPGDRLWVYGRGGKPCRRCGASILMRRMGPDARSTYWCPVCQRR